MKILDLLEDPYQSIKKDINLNRDIKSNPKNKSDYDAKGYFSTVKDKKNDPFMVRKTSNHFIDHFIDKDLYRGDQYDAKEHDGYWEFIDDIITHPELKNNPFFPRVYNIKTIIDKSGKKVYRADIEKLHPFMETIPDKTLLSYLSSLFTKEASHKIINISNPAFVFRGATPYYSSILKFVLYISGITDGEHSINDIDNNEFKEAVKYIQAKSGKWFSDIGVNNLMLRLTNHGPQLVFSDPLGGKSI